MFHRGWFQLVVRDARLSDALRDVLTLYSTVRTFQEASGWPALTDVSRLAGVLVEYGPGFEAWLADVRRKAPTLPVLVLTPLLDGAFLNRLQARQVEVGCLPLHGPQVVAFVQRALAFDFVPHERVSRLVAHLAAQCSLTSREVQLIAFCLGDETRARVRRRLGISENTLKTQIKGLLRKCGERNVDSLAKNLLRAAVLAEPGRQRSAEPIAPWLRELPGAA